MAILEPLMAQVAWTFLVMALIPLRRFRAAHRGEVGAGDFRYGESDRVPAPVSLPNRNYMNLLELPVLFYTGCLTALVAGVVDGTLVALAWGFVAARVVHSLVHILWNRVLPRFAVFAIGALLLLVFWGLLFARLSA